MKLTEIDLNLMLVLHYMLEDPSVTRTARRLSVTPPAVSNALNRLRDQLDDPLFVKHGRTLLPTPRALELAEELAAAMAGLARVVHQEESDPARTERTFRLCLTDADCSTTLPCIAAAMRRQMPRAHLEVVSVDTLLAHGGLQAGAADCNIGPAMLIEPDLHHVPLYQTAAVLVAHRDHPLARCQQLSPADLNEVPFVDVLLAMGRGGVGNRAAQDVFAAHGITRRIACSVPSFMAAVSVALATDMITGLPLPLARQLQKTLPIALLDFPGLGIPFSMALLWHERTHLDPLCVAFRALVQRAVEEEFAREMIHDSERIAHE